MKTRKILAILVLTMGLVSSALATDYLWTNDYPWSGLWISPWNWDPVSPSGGPGVDDTAHLEGGPAQGPVLDAAIAAIQVDRILGPQYLGPNGMTVYLMGDCNLVVNDWDANDAGDGVGTVIMQDDAKADINDEAWWTDHGTHIVHMSGNASATFHSTWQAGDGNDAWFELYMTDNTSLSVNGALRIGDDGGGIYDFSGSATVHAGSWLIQARDAAAVGTMNVSNSASVYVEQTTGVQLDGGAGTVTMNVSDVAEVNTCTLVVGGGGSGTLDITDMATVIVRCCLRIPDNDGGTGVINLLGGTLHTACIEHGGDNWTIDICGDGVMLVDGDVSGDIEADVAAGYITAYGGRAIVVVDFNNVNPGKTTIWARSVRYVDGDANGTGDGTSWENAYNYLQDALLDANSNLDIEIWVAAGVYKPDANSTHTEGTGDRAATFQLINRVVLRGGYAGCDANDPNVRDFELYRTILSGDINVPGDASDNSYHVVQCVSGEDANTILEGFTITGGNATGDGSGHPWNHTYLGGGMYNYYSSPTVKDCNFNGNSAQMYGGGMYNEEGLPTVTDCNFSGNSANYGGGMYNDHLKWWSEPMANCTFRGNTATGSGGGMCNTSSHHYVVDCTFSGNSAYRGGGVWNGFANPTLINCTFASNMTTGSLSAGGGMYNHSCGPDVIDCNFSGNSTSGSGGGIRNYASPVRLSDCTFSGNIADVNGGGMSSSGTSGGYSATVTNCTFSGNSANFGGGMENSYSSPTVTNCTFSGNGAFFDGGGIYNYDSNPTVANCILWGDTLDEIYDGGSSSATVSYSDVEGGWGGAGGNNINADPGFVDAAGGDLRLGTCSPCVDAGNNAAVPGGVTTDLDGNPRFVDDTGVVDTGAGTAPIVDMGAYERQCDSVLTVNNVTRGRSYCSIQLAIDDANDDDEIEVGPGTYYEAINFIGKAITLRSSDPNDPNVVAATVIDGTGHYHVVQCVNGEGPNTVLSGFTITGGSANGGEHPHWHGGGMLNDGNSSPTVTNCTFTGNKATFDGAGIFNWDNSNPTVTDCNFSSNSAQRYGGGMASYSSSPTVTNCTFSDNSAVNNGGGMFDSNSSPTVTNCNFSGNSAGWDGGGMDNEENSSPTVNDCNFSSNSAVGNDGGAINNRSSSPTITNCNFSDNSAYDWGGAVRNVWSSSPTLTNCIFAGNSSDEGGGMFNWDNSSPTVTNCTFSGNIADANGGGMGNYSGSSPKVTDCTFSNNIAEVGGGMDNEYSSSPTVTNCTFTNNSATIYGGGMENYNLSSPMVTNCVFRGNSADFGGGMDNSSSSPTMTNCTFSGNSAFLFGFGGGMCNYESSPTVTNCILWGDEPDEIYDDFGCFTTVNYSDVEGGWWGAGGNNIDADPGFVDADANDFRLLYYSPCIDAGDNDSVPADTADLDGDSNTVEPIPFDLGGLPRFVDDLCTGDSGNGAPPVVDMGAYEYLPGDIDGSGAVDLGDFCEFALHWADTGCGRCGGANMDCDADVDWSDLAELVDWWLAGK